MAKHPPTVLLSSRPFFALIARTLETPHPGHFLPRHSRTRVFVSVRPRNLPGFVSATQTGLVDRGQEREKRLGLVPIVTSEDRSNDEQGRGVGFFFAWLGLVWRAAHVVGRRRIEGEGLCLIGGWMWEMRQEGNIWLVGWS